MTDNEITTMQPRGHSSAHEAGLLAGVSGNRIGQCARRGYVRASQSDYPPYVYSYQDVGEAILVHELLDEGVTHRRVRRAIETLRERHGNRWPLQGADLATDGRDVLALEGEAAWDVGDRIWQQKIEPENLRQIAGQLRRGGWAARALPDLAHIEVNPDRLSGRPTIVGRRVPVEVVAQIAEEPGGIEDLHEGFDLSDAEINDARKWWHVVREYAAAA